MNYNWYIANVYVHIDYYDVIVLINYCIIIKFNTSFI